MPDKEDSGCPIPPEKRSYWLSKLSGSKKPDNVSALDTKPEELSADITGNNADGCPVPTEKRSSWLSKISGTSKSESKSISSESNSSDACPVPAEGRAEWLKKVGSSSSPVAGEQVFIPSSQSDVELSCDSNKLGNDDPVYKTNVKLSENREVSSIPRTDANGNWIYPSQKQFYEAMVRKNWSPDAQDMQTIIPIHNNINERCWNFIKYWEKGLGGETCGGIKLSSFKGDSKKLTPRAMIRTYLLGYEKPFDRHDWTVNRCGKEVDYVIDFYSEDDPTGKPHVLLDVRPKLNSFEGIKMRFWKFFE